MIFFQIITKKIQIALSRNDSEAKNRRGYRNKCGITVNI